MSRLRVACVAAVLALCAAGANADSLPLPDTLTGFSTPEGEAYFAESDAREAYFPLASNFVTQKTQTYCGVASMVMVLNALGLPAPAAPEYAPYRTFTQDNLLSEQTDAVLPRETLARQGMTLDQLGAILATQPVHAEVRHASESSADINGVHALSRSGRFNVRTTTSSRCSCRIVSKAMARPYASF